MLRTLGARVVALTLAVALLSALATGVAVARAAGITNREQAAAALGRDAVTLAALVESAAARPRAGRVRDAAVEAFQRRLARGDVVSAVVTSEGSGDPLTPPLTAEDEAAVAAGGAVDDVRRYDGEQWIVVGRAAGADVVLLAQPVEQAVELTPAQRRRIGLAALAGLLVGALGGALLARGVTRPLRDVAACARRLTAGERGLRVPAGGPVEVAEVAEALDALARELAESEERRRSFLAAVSHELRTPLTVVSGYAEAMADGELPPEELPAAAGVVRVEAARLGRRIDDLLMLARLESPEFSVRRETVDVGQLLRAAATAWAPTAQAAGVDLRLESPPEGPWADTDGERLRQIVDALADNALRVLPPAAPLVLATRDVAGGVVVEVRDGGPGLAEEDLVVAFERGRLTERYRGVRPVGSGIGLALVGELARRVGGSAHAARAPEGGVSFSVVLPGRQEHPPGQ